MITFAPCDHTLRLWHFSNGQLLRTIKGHQNEVTCCSFAPGGETRMGHGQFCLVGQDRDPKDRHPPDPPLRSPQCEGGRTEARYRKTCVPSGTHGMAAPAPTVLAHLCWPPLMALPANSLQMAVAAWPPVTSDPWSKVGSSLRRPSFDSLR